MNFRVLFLFLLANIFFVDAQNVSNINEASKTVHSKNYQSITFNGIWSWFTDPRAVYFEGEHKRTYTGWVDNYGDIHVAYFDHTTKALNSKVIFDNLEIDDHNNPSILIDKNGYLIMFFSSHLQGEKPLYMLKSNTPESIEDWRPVKELYLNDKDVYKNAKNLNHTYTNPIQLSAENDKIFLFWRGVDLKPTYATSSDNGNTWSSGKILFMPEEVNAMRVPYTKVYSDGVSKIHFTFTDGHPTKEVSNALYYMYYENGAFYKANGKKIKTVAQLPIQQQDLDVIYKQTSENNTVWNWDIAQNKNGDPILVYVKFPDSENHIYCYAIWKNNEWINYNLVNSGNWFPETPEGSEELEPNYSGGITIDHESPNTLYLSVKRKGIFEIEKWITNNEGKSWAIEKITSNSTKNNIRPFAIKNAKKETSPQVLWVQNTKYISYSLSAQDKKTQIAFKDRYQSAIKIDAEYPEIDNTLSSKNIILLTRELLDWQLENPSENIKKTDYKYGVFCDGIKAFWDLTNDNRYKNELDNIIQYEEEEEEFETLAVEDLIWHFNTKNDRPFLNKLNALNIESINKINDAIKTVTLSKLLTLINEDDNYATKDIFDLYKRSLDDELKKEKEYTNPDKFFINALSVYTIAKGINNGMLPRDEKARLLESWQSLIKIIINKKYQNVHWDIGNTGIILLGSKEIVDLIEN
ncbi:BNR-4 repeat-containing protein [Lacinutrix jangbogonensis]|uniref:BNR-4 repeat-containing protein n=1 Tax=Lacinutrix jangbogonensis TaxID=1469557 RepID=UPI00053EAC3D|nr:BNR-4 repeat-containing protein [Lacinutrix jangbogonensis]